MAITNTAKHGLLIDGENAANAGAALTIREFEADTVWSMQTLEGVSPR